MTLKNKKIGFIGGGNMAEALITGLLQAKAATRTRICVAEPLAKRRNALKQRFGVKVVNSNQDLVAQSDIIVLAVKPQVMSEVLQDIAGPLRKRQLIISIAAGIDTALLRRHLGSGTRLVRAMPNTPALVGAGITGLFIGKGVSRSDRLMAEALFQSVGDVIWVKKEKELDWVTALSGSGPAYGFLFLESLVKAARQGGLAASTAEKLALATLHGAVSLARNSDVSFETLRKRVTSKGGTTEAALNVLNKKRWSPAMQQAIRTAARRAYRLRQEAAKK